MRCGLSGMPFAGLTGHSGTTPLYYCYCGLQPDPSVVSTAASFCNLTCPGNHSQSCGGSGYMSLTGVVCNQPLPPAAVGPTLAPGRACSQAAAQRWPFCNASLPVDVRVQDLVNRISMTEAGGLLTARESIAIGRLGLPSFYWGTNAIHGISIPCATMGHDVRCASSFPETIALSSSFNRSLFRAVGAVVGKELRAFTNAKVTPNIGLTSWYVTCHNNWVSQKYSPEPFFLPLRAPTINIIRDPRRYLAVTLFVPKASRFPTHGHA